MVELFELVLVSRTIAETYVKIAHDLGADWRLTGAVEWASFLFSFFSSRFNYYGRFGNRSPEDR